MGPGYTQGPPDVTILFRYVKLYFIKTLTISNFSTTTKKKFETIYWLGEGVSCVDGTIRIRECCGTVLNLPSNL